MRLAIIGLGSIGTRHLKNALALGCEVSVVDSNPERELAARAMGASIGPFETAPDAMMVCTPYDKHLEAVQWAVEYRVPVFCEKPLGSLDQIEDWRRLVQASEGLVTQVGYMCRFHPQVVEGRKAIGEAKYVDCCVECDMATWQGASYGHWLLECSHEIDLAQSFNAGELQGLLYDEAGREACCVFERGRVNIGASYKSYRREWFSRGASKFFQVFADSPQRLGDEMYLSELKHFLECVQSGLQTDVPLADGLRVLEVCQQIEQMARATA